MNTVNDLIHRYGRFATVLSVLVTACSNSSDPLMFSCTVVEKYWSYEYPREKRSNKEIFYILQKEPYYQLGKNFEPDQRPTVDWVLTENNKLKFNTNRKVTVDGDTTNFESKLLVDNNVITHSSTGKRGDKLVHSHSLEINRVTGQYSSESKNFEKDGYSFSYEGHCVRVKDRKL